MHQHVAAAFFIHTNNWRNLMAKSSKTSDKTIQQAQSIVSDVQLLAGRCEKWQKNEYARSNKILYELLAKIQTAYMNASTSKELLKETVAQMKKDLTARKVRVQMNTVPLTLFVRYVFNNDRQQAMNYSRTIQAAISAKVAPGNLAAFIEKEGGVEMCKKKNPVTREAAKKQANIAKALVQVNEQLNDDFIKPLAVFKVPKQLIPAKANNDDLTLCLARTDGNGNVKIICIVPKSSSGVTNWAKNQMARLLMEKQDQASIASAAQAKNDAIDKAKKAASKSKKPTATVGELLAA
jgi:hypothetical protein